ncbi:MAG: immunoglobulin-like domain-containing protein, partial [Methylococcaceae bacterium]
MNKKNNVTKFFSISLFLCLFSSTVFAELNAQWSLDENSGTIANDQSGNGLHLNLNNMSETNWVSGQFNSALNFNGSDQDASIPSGTSILQTESVTLSAWVYPVRTSVSWEWVATQSDNYGLVLRPRQGTETVIFYVKNAGSGWTQAISPLNTLEFDQWQHIAGTFDASTNTSKLYVNGVEVSSVDVGQSIGYTRGDGFTIGSKGSQFFNGSIDEVRVYDSALTSTEIFQLSALDDITPPVITLNGANPVSVAPGAVYTDAGATAIDDVDGSVIVTHDAGTVVDTDIEGNSYLVTFTSTDLAGNIAEATRVVNIATPVPDTTPPVITLNGENPVSVALDAGYTDAGATAIDEIDGSVSVSHDADIVVDTSTEGSYTVTFTATDLAGNTANTTRIVEVIVSSAPVITLIGDDSINMPLNVTYTDPGATAFDNEDGISVDVDVDVSNIDIFVMGSYSVIFTATDSENNTSIATRTVVVVDPVPGALKILPLGDSITDSINGRASYRRPLWHQLKAAGYAVDFVGRPGYRHSTVPESLLDYDIDHEGHAGSETQSIRSQILGWMNEFTADIVLLHIGTNDLNGGLDRGEVPIETVNETLNEINDIIQRIRTKNSSVIILLAKIIPMRHYDTAIFN